MNNFIITLNCQYCGRYMGWIQIEDIEQPRTKDIQCYQCDVKEQ